MRTGNWQGQSIANVSAEKIRVAAVLGSPLGCGIEESAVLATGSVLLSVPIGRPVSDIVAQFSLCQRPFLVLFTYEGCSSVRMSSSAASMPGTLWYASDASFLPDVLKPVPLNKPLGRKLAGASTLHIPFDQNIRELLTDDRIDGLNAALQGTAVVQWSGADVIGREGVFREVLRRQLCTWRRKRCRAAKRSEDGEDQSLYGSAGVDASGDSAQLEDASCSPVANMNVPDEAVTGLESGARSTAPSPMWERP